LTQTAGRAARNINGKVIMYADKVTESMRLTIDETNRRREKQIKYNQDNGITPTSLNKSKSDILGQSSVVGMRQEGKKAYAEDASGTMLAADPVMGYLSIEQLEQLIVDYRHRMEVAAKDLDFLEAARFRDEINLIEGLLLEKRK
jgi:excinuclease ABC subunit B